MPSSSYVAIEAGLVLEMAANTLANIAKSRQTRWDEYAIKQAAAHNKTWYHKLFKLRDWTIADILQRELNTENWVSQHWWIFNWYCNESEVVAQKLLQAASIALKNSYQPMQISVADLNLIG